MENRAFDIKLSNKMPLANSMRSKISSIQDRLIYRDQTLTPPSFLMHHIESTPTTPAFARIACITRLSFLQLVLCLTSLVLFGYVYKHVAKDYRAFLALGPGGTPCSFHGYTRLALISFFRLRDPYLPPKMISEARPQRGYLKELQARQGIRPRLVGIAPQRQVTQNCSRMMVQALQHTIRELVKECPSHWYVARSAFEKHNEALFSRFKTFTEPDYYGEIVHSHTSDGSMHLTLHPADVKTVLDKGWGERHPLARGRTWWWHSPCPCGFMIIYGPRDRAELQQVKSIIRAAAWWVSGVDSRKEEHDVHHYAERLGATTIAD